MLAAAFKLFTMAIGWWLTSFPQFHKYTTMESKDAVPALAALAQEHRLAVFRLLVQAGLEGLPPGVIAERLALAPPTLSFHLAQLKHAGLVLVRRDGRSLIYTVNYDAMNGLMAFLTDNCCGSAAVGCSVPVCEPKSATLVRRRATRTARPTTRAA
jgi:ArsR family transcriptional regulator